MPANLQSLKPTVVSEITDTQKTVMRHFVNAVAQATQMHNSKVLTFEKALDDPTTPEHVAQEVAERVDADYTLLWEILEQLIDTATVQKEV